MSITGLEIASPELLSKIELLKKEKENLITLKNKMIKSKEELVNSNLSGKTYEESIKNNETFINNINNKINLFTAFISSLEKALGVYQSEDEFLNNSVRG
jgi:hypothetical protein